MSRLPEINHKHNICVICEGDEDFAYFSRLTELSVWNEIYRFVSKNAHGESNIPSMYESIFQNDSYEIVLIFCDTDKFPHKEYKNVKDKIAKFHGVSNKTKLTEHIIIFANPCTMQIVLSHFGSVSLKNQGKKTNAAVIEEFTGIANYDAHEDQIREICSKIFRRTYPDMKSRITVMDKPDTESGSTNFIKYLEKFESAYPDWICNTRTFLNKPKR